MAEHPLGVFAFLKPIVDQEPAALDLPAGLGGHAGHAGRADGYFSFFSSSENVF